MGAFDSIRNGLGSLEQQTAISADEWFEMLCSFHLAVFARNGLKFPGGAVDMRAKDVEDCFLSLGKVFGPCLAFYQANRHALDTLDERDRRILDELTAVSGALGAQRESIERYLRDGQSLREERAGLERATRQALAMQEENAALREEIARLSDIRLDEIRAENDRLHAETEERRERERALRKEEAAAHLELEALEKDLVRLEGQLAGEQARHEINQCERGHLLRELGTYRQRVVEYRQWLAGWPQEQQDIKAEYDGINARAQVLLNAWTAENAQAFPREAITVFHEFRDYFTRRGEELRLILDEYQVRYQRLVEASQELTKKKE